MILHIHKSIDIFLNSKLKHWDLSPKANSQA
jgi:hypothetical protein